MKDIIRSFGKLIGSSKKYIIVFGGCFVLGSVFGLTFTTALSKAAMSESVIRFYFKAFAGDFSPWSFAFKFLLSDLSFLALAFLCSFTIYTYLISAAFIFYRGYVITSACLLFIRLFGVGGTFLYVFCVFLHSVAVSVTLVIFCSFTFFAMKNCRSSVKRLRKDILILCIGAIFVAILAALAILLLLLRPVNATF